MARRILPATTGLHFSWLIDLRLTRYIYTVSHGRDRFRLFYGSSFRKIRNYRIVKSISHGYFFTHFPECGGCRTAYIRLRAILGTYIRPQRDIPTFLAKDKSLLIEETEKTAIFNLYLLTTELPRLFSREIILLQGRGIKN